MKPTTFYESSCRKLISLLSSILNVDADAAYTMMLFTAALYDLPPDDEEVVRIILNDCEPVTEEA